MTAITLKGQVDCTDPNEAARLPAEIKMAKQMAEVLQKLYPRHRWATFADSRGGIGWIAIPELMGDKQRMVIHLSQIEDYTEMVKVLRAAGGEILERYRQPRGAFRLCDFQEAASKVRRIGSKIIIPE